MLIAEEIVLYAGIGKGAGEGGIMLGEIYTGRNVSM